MTKDIMRNEENYTTIETIERSLNDNKKIINEETAAVLQKKRSAFKVLSPEQLAIVKEKCNQAIENKQLNIIPSDKEITEAFDILRADYLDENLPLPDRSIRNITITPEQFRENANIITKKIIESICLEYDKKNIIPVYIWRAGLFPFMQSCINAEIDNHTHIGLARNEKTLNPIQYLPLTLDIRTITKDSKILLADPMLATWWSLIKVIRKLLQLWIPEDQILIATVISAPEWIDKILSNYPKIKIYTWSLDDHLNEAWYICIWLGDFGDKVTEWITLEYLNALKPYMKNNIFEILVKKLIPEK